MQGEFLDRRDLQLLFQGIHEKLILFRALPRTLVVTCKIVCAALGVFAEAFERHKNTHRPFGRIKPIAYLGAQFLELLGIGPHKQILRVVPEEFAVLILFGHVAYPKIGMVDRPRHDHLRQTGRARGG
jgi:hypothetical protein